MRNMFICYGHVDQDELLLERLSTTTIHKPLPRGKGFESTSEERGTTLVIRCNSNFNRYSWNYDTNVYNETIRLTVMYYETIIHYRFN